MYFEFNEALNIFGVVYFIGPFGLDIYKLGRSVLRHNFMDVM